MFFLAFQSTSSQVNIPSISHPVSMEDSLKPLSDLVESVTGMYIAPTVLVGVLTGVLALLIALVSAYPLTDFL